MTGKYIFILAQDGDVTVNEVMSWLEYDGSYNVVRINDTDRIRFLHVSIGATQTDFEICINDLVSVKLSQIHAYWYRRGKFSYRPLYTSQKADYTLVKSIDTYYSDEFEHSVETLHFLLKSYVPSINTFKDIYTNKLINLECAKQAGLRIPDSIVSNDPAAIRAFLQKHPKCIVKPVRLPGSKAFTPGGDIYYAQATHLITTEEVEDFLLANPVFQPTHFQEYIDKEFEIRTFILHEKLFSMAIFSQQNEKTKVDFRNYDEEKPNRNVPFQLPDSLEKQLLTCCRLIGIHSGSVDLLYKQGHYYFLEINPVGQLQWLSHNCNYPVEKHIAQTLIAS